MVRIALVKWGGIKKVLKRRPTFGVRQVEAKEAQEAKEQYTEETSDTVEMAEERAESRQLNSFISAPTEGDVVGLLFTTTSAAPPQGTPADDRRFLEQQQKGFQMLEWGVERFKSLYVEALEPLQLIADSLQQLSQAHPPAPAPSSPPPPGEEVYDGLKEQELTHNKARANVLKSQQKTKLKRAKKGHEDHFNADDQVPMKNTRQEHREGGKMESDMLGPFTETMWRMDVSKETKAVGAVCAQNHWTQVLVMSSDEEMVPFLYRSASMHSSRPPSLLGLRPPEHRDCNGKGSPAVLGPTHVSVEENTTEDENAEEEVQMGRSARLFHYLEKKQPEWCKQRDTWSLYLFPPESRFRIGCNKIITHKMFDHVVLVIIFLNCITIAMERPRIDPGSAERIFLTLSNYIFTSIFVAEMTVKAIFGQKKDSQWAFKVCRTDRSIGLVLRDKAYLRSSWNILDGMLVMISVIDILVSLISNSGTKILGMLRVLRLLRTLRPLRVISRAPGLKLVVETLMSSLKPIGNIVVICCAFFIIFGILGVQLFKGKFFVCQGEDVRNITNKSDCLQASYKWVRHKYNFDNLGQALMSLFVLASKDGWVDIMYDGLDAVGVDQQPIMNYNPWMLLYFISFLLIVAFFVLNMFVGVVVENFHKCRRHQEAEEAKRREEKRLKRLEKKRRSKEKELAGR
ncbi:hypothetical protein WMY93_010165 [Mugilogobius chulae]|uniref:Ion transport domain-containing protein n=1 Tax=Mugilogobius chulae TaxID=88201 RepID=A0AAW0PI33_9GOBI